MNAKYILGEDKHVTLLIHSQNDEPFKIESATYELKRSGNVEDSGACVIDGHYVKAKLSPEATGFYDYIVTYSVADETRKAKIRIEVD